MLPFELTKDTPYLALSGELWSVFYEYFNRNWSCYKGFLLYYAGWLTSVEHIWWNIQLILSVTFFIFAIYGDEWVPLSHSRLGDQEDIFVTHFIIIKGLKVSTLPIVFIFFHGWVSEVVVQSYSLSYKHICIYPEKSPGFLFISLISVSDVCKYSNTLRSKGHFCLVAHYTIS